MGNKYYTPEIEEFHVGFDFEVFEVPFKLGATKADGKWVAGSLDTPKHFQAVNWDYLEREVKEKGVIRVKQLDRKDIESFGFDILFIPDGAYERSMGWMTFKNTKTPIEYRLNIIRDAISTYDVVTIYIEGINDSFFDGIIKNKSELEKILKMTRVI